MGEGRGRPGRGCRGGAVGPARAEAAAADAMQASGLPAAGLLWGASLAAVDRGTSSHSSPPAPRAAAAAADSASAVPTAIAAAAAAADLLVLLRPPPLLQALLVLPPSLLLTAAGALAPPPLKPLPSAAHVPLPSVEHVPLLGVCESCGAGAAAAAARGVAGGGRGAGRLGSGGASDCCCVTTILLPLLAAGVLGQLLQCPALRPPGSPAPPCGASRACGCSATTMPVAARSGVPAVSVLTAWHAPRPAQLHRVSWVIRGQTRDLRLFPQPGCTPSRRAETGRRAALRQACHHHRGACSSPKGCVNGEADGRVVRQQELRGLVAAEVAVVFHPVRRRGLEGAPHRIRRHPEQQRRGR